MPYVNQEEYIKERLKKAKEREKREEWFKSINSGFMTDDQGDSGV